MSDPSSASSAEPSASEKNSSSSSTQVYSAFNGDSNNNNNNQSHDEPPLSSFGGGAATSSSVETDLRDAFGSSSKNNGTSSHHGDESPLHFASTNFTSAVSRMPGTGHPDRSNITWTDKEGVVYYYYTNPILMVCPFILVQELGERLAYFGLTPTLKPFLKKTLHVEDAEASAIIGLFRGVLFLTPVIAGVLADSFLGVYYTIRTFSYIYIAGLALMVIATIESISSPWMVYVSIFALICVGGGGIRTCVNVFGAQQFHPTDQKELITSYFSYFYTTISVGSVVGGVVCAQVQQDAGFTAAYSIPFVAFILICVVFACGTDRYLRFKPQGSPIIRVAKVIWSAIRHCGFEKCKKTHGGDQDDEMVDDTVQLLKIQPISALTVPMMISHNQTTTAFLTQGEKMSNKIFGTSFSPAMMQNIGALCLILCSVFVEKIIYPKLRARNMMPTVLGRFVFGNCMAVLAIMMAYIVEIEIMSGHQPKSVTIWAQVPQFSVLSIAEIFVIGTSYEVAFTLAPHKLKAAASACNLLWYSVAGFISSALFIACEPWLLDFHIHEYSTFQKSHYDYYFLVLACSVAAGAVMCVVLRGYFYRLLARVKQRAAEDPSLTSPSSSPPRYAARTQSVMLPSSKIPSSQSGSGGACAKEQRLLEEMDEV